MSEPEARGATYGVELFFDRPYDLASPALAAHLRAECPRAEVHVKKGVVAVFHSDVTNPDAPTVAAQTLVLGSDASVDVAEVESAIAQSRAWPGARAAVSRARHRLLVTDLLSSFLPAPIRLEVFQRVLLAVVRALSPVAISWGPAGSLVDPSVFLLAMASPEPQERAILALNVRLFQVGDRDGECVMDTLGLGALMLPDLQIHFTDLDPNDVARHLFNTALYVLEKGDVLAEGNTIRGLDDDQKWLCVREESIAGPKRVVVDFDPGPPFSAGDRER